MCIKKSIMHKCNYRFFYLFHYISRFRTERKIDKILERKEHNICIVNDFSGLLNNLLFIFQIIYYKIIYYYYKNKTGTCSSKYSDLLVNRSRFNKNLIFRGLKPDVADCSEFWKKIRYIVTCEYRITVFSLWIKFYAAQLKTVQWKEIVNVQNAKLTSFIERHRFRWQSMCPAVATCLREEHVSIVRISLLRIGALHIAREKRSQRP